MSEGIKITGDKIILHKESLRSYDECAVPISAFFYTREGNVYFKIDNINYKVKESFYDILEALENYRINKVININAHVKNEY